MVVHKKTNRKILARKARGVDWTALLAATGLESPGYQEVVAQIRAEQCQQANGAET